MGGGLPPVPFPGEELLHGSLKSQLRSWSPNGQELALRSSWHSEVTAHTQHGKNKHMSHMAAHVLHRATQAHTLSHTHHTQNHASTATHRAAHDGTHRHICTNMLVHTHTCTHACMRTGIILLPKLPQAPSHMSPRGTIALEPPPQRGLSLPLPPSA